MYEIYDIIDNINGKIRKNYPHELCYTLKFGLEINLVLLHIKIGWEISDIQLFEIWPPGVPTVLRNVQKIQIFNKPGLGH